MDYKSKNLTNDIQDIDYDYLKKMYEDNKSELKQAEEMTASSYRGENFYDSIKNQNIAFFEELTKRDPQTSGMRVQYPHGIIIAQAALKNFYRGENQIYESSVPSLIRKLSIYKTEKEKALYRLVADMRIAEFRYLLKQFDHVKKWNKSDVLYDVLAQHYGLETGWLDITSNFNVALFFATCYYDKANKEWKPLTKKQTEVDEAHKYGMLFHMRSYFNETRWLKYHNVFGTDFASQRDDGVKHKEKIKYPQYPYNKVPQNLIYQIGFQPFMRCSMQYGYAIYMRDNQPLQNDLYFEKLRFRHSEKLSNAVFEMMEGGKKVYPHEGLLKINYKIKDISNSTTFSKSAFEYALLRSHEYSMCDKDKCLADLNNFKINGNAISIVNYHPCKISCDDIKTSAEGYTLSDGTPLNLSDKDQKWQCLKDTSKF